MSKNQIETIHTYIERDPDGRIVKKSEMKEIGYVPVPKTTVKPRPAIQAAKTPCDKSLLQAKPPAKKEAPKKKAPVKQASLLQNIQ